MNYFCKSIYQIVLWLSLIPHILFSDGELYSGTVADFSASDSLIIKNVTSAKKWDNRLTRLRTEQYDFKQLNGKYEFNIQVRFELQNKIKHPKWLQKIIFTFTSF